ncbi:MAG: hypothetical protein E7263_09380 [Lachnospiraceae bacterium]|nr:hypothetical protein [Lachnospiraceae bacterium]
MKRKIICLMVLLSLFLVGCNNNSNKEKQIYRDWDKVTISFQYNEIQLDNNISGFEELKSLSSLDMLTQLDYNDGFEECFGNPVLEIELVENDKIYDYIIYTDRVIYIDYYSIYDKCAEITKAEFNLLLDQLLPVIGDNYFYAGCETGEKYKEKSEHTKKYDEMIATNRFEEHYAITNDPKGQWIYYNYKDNDNYGYMEMQFRINDANLPDVSHYYEFEYNGMYAYEKYDFYGEKTRINNDDMPEIIPLKEQILGDMMYESSSKLTYKDCEIIRERYNIGSSKKCVAYFEDAGMNAVLYQDGKIYTIAYYSIDEKGAFDGDYSSGFIAQPQANNTYSNLNSNIDDNTNDNEISNSGNVDGDLNNNTSSVWNEEIVGDYDYYTKFNKYNKFDFEAERVKGDSIDNPGIVESYRNIFVKGNCYTVYITSLREDGYMTSQYTTQSGDDYFSESISEVPGEYVMIGNDVCVAGRKYYRLCYEGENEKYKLDPYGGEYGPYVGPIIQGSETEELNDDEFVEAYYVYINDDEYICEVWHAGVTDFFVYCKNNEVIAIEADYKAAGFTKYVVEYVFDYAQIEKIVEPSDYIERSE